jgi:glycosyltransferase involved in cell wall biosynthesis
MAKMISVVTPCYNEEPHVREVYERVKAVFSSFPQYRYEHLFIDNASRDRTLHILKLIASEDRNVKVIANARNFGHLRSPMHAMFQASGDAVALLFSDLQDPPELLAQMVDEWQKGMPVVLAIKAASDENRLMFWIRTRYYRLVNRLADIDIYENFTGFGLYDRRVIEIVRSLDDPYPYFRGMIAEIGLPCATLPYRQKQRVRGVTKNNFYTLYDLAMLGITNVSKVPLRLTTFFGFGCGLLSILFAACYAVYKLLFWNSFSVGIAPMVIGLFFFASVQLIFIGILGEYIGAIHTQVMKRPLVIERERINFDNASAPEGVQSAAWSSDGV